jgi:hypothetical protein
MPQQPAHARIALGRFEAEAEVGPAALLAVGALVSAILLSSAVIVRAAKSRPAPDPTPHPRLPPPEA